jgi:hypothetical protein
MQLVDTFEEKQLLVTEIENCLNLINQIQAIVTHFFAAVKYKSSIFSIKMVNIF